ncbi:hypothetical protein C8J57DRAFT_1241097 [Mycena rebaudengoi]|nr:hypothetical protein C8J57DRAFT_1241097 [Mycena rebaudengoi]
MWERGEEDQRVWMVDGRKGVGGGMAVMGRGVWVEGRGYERNGSAVVDTHGRRSRRIDGAEEDKGVDEEHKRNGRVKKKGCGADRKTWLTRRRTDKPYPLAQARVMIFAACRLTSVVMRDDGRWGGERGRLMGQWKEDAEGGIETKVTDRERDPLPDLRRTRRDKQVSEDKGVLGTSVLTEKYVPSAN